MILDAVTAGIFVATKMSVRILCTRRRFGEDCEKSSATRVDLGGFVHQTFAIIYSCLGII